MSFGNWYVEEVKKCVLKKGVDVNLRVGNLNRFQDMSEDHKLRNRIAQAAQNYVDTPL